MRLRIGPGEDRHTLLLEGELDLATASQLRDAVDLCALPEGDIVLDCSKLTFVDAAGAHTIVSIAEQLPVGSRMVVTGTSGLALRVMLMLRVDQHPRIELLV